jgi:hypothetical protein
MGGLIEGLPNQASPYLPGTETKFRSALGLDFLSIE